jgi:hypothetical protein
MLGPVFCQMLFFINFQSNRFVSSYYRQEVCVCVCACVRACARAREENLLAAFLAEQLVADLRMEEIRRRALVSVVILLNHGVGQVNGFSRIDYNIFLTLTLL